jgi:hypothetical protein
LEKAWSRQQNEAKRFWLDARPQTVRWYGKAAQQRQNRFAGGSKSGAAPHAGYLYTID